MGVCSWSERRFILGELIDHGPVGTPVGMARIGLLMGMALVVACTADPVDVNYGPYSRDGFVEFEESPQGQSQWWGSCYFYPAVPVSVRVSGLELEEAKGTTTVPRSTSSTS